MERLRESSVCRSTKETDIKIKINLDGRGEGRISTGIPFMDHMLTLFARHGLFDLEVAATGDLDIDCHHTMEDLGLTLGQALAQALGDKAGIRRYGHFTLPMEETLCTSALDLGGRAYFVFEADFPSTKIGDFDAELVADFWHAFATNALCNLHIIVHHGRNSHHIAEAIFKATARSLRMAVEPDPQLPGVPSTKGTLC